ncbi:hypothetical protein NQZ68_024537 [Dissostichus eleginoides]|nr:hypothetical protein NQZ68_024537 [Dissostichus eleginoides]
MKRFLLLFLSLMTGCEARSEDKERKNIRVVIKEIQQEQTYKLHFRPEHKPNKKDKEEVELELYNRCQKPFNPIADRTHTIIIKCGKENEDDSRCNLFCKENGPICEDILSTKNNLRSNGTFTLTETESGFTVSISNVSTQHTGVYWCGVEIKDRKIWYRAALRKIEVKVHRELLTTSSTSSTSRPPTTLSPTASSTCSSTDSSGSSTDSPTASSTGSSTDSSGSSTDSPTDSPTGSPTASSTGSSTVSTTQSNSAQKDGVSWIPRVAAVVCVALLGLLLFLVFCYKHSCCSKNKRKGEAHNVEDHANDEIQERPLVTGPGTALQSLYVTANAPTNPSASPYYSTINAPTDPSASLDYSTITAHNISAEAGGETYSTVRDQAQSAAYSTVNHPSRLPEDPFYSSVNHPQPQQT